MVEEFFNYSSMPLSYSSEPSTSNDLNNSQVSMQQFENVESGDDETDSEFDDDCFSPLELDLSQQQMDSQTMDNTLISKFPLRKIQKQVTILNVSQNQLIHFPVHISCFNNLVSNNQLVLLPDQLVNLTNLKTFSARNNVLESLPKQWHNLQNLEVLNLSGNFFNAIPSSIYQMKKLKALYFGANRIEVLDSVIGTLTELEILYLGGNRLTEVPATLGRLRKLTSLVLADNSLTTLPPTMEDLSSLRSLTLHNNHIRTLPTGIARLPRLDHLSLRNNPLITHFVDCLLWEPPTLKEITARVVKIRVKLEEYSSILPFDLLDYLKTANQCVNPKCKGVYFESCVELVKFVDFCGKYRVPLLQYLCSPHCSNKKPACAFSDTSSASEMSDVDEATSRNFPGPSTSSMSTSHLAQSSTSSSATNTAKAKMKKVLLG